MGILFNSTILLNIVIYAILFNIIYSMLYKVNSFWLNVIIYVVAMEIKLFILYNGEFISCYTIFISLLVYFILGIIIIKIMDRVSDYYARLPFVIAGVGIALLTEWILGGILFIIIELIAFIVYLYIESLIKSIIT